jgi:hypothetical protein
MRSRRYGNRRPLAMREPCERAPKLVFAIGAQNSPTHFCASIAILTQPLLAVDVQNSHPPTFGHLRASSAECPGRLTSRKPPNSPKGTASRRKSCEILGSGQVSPKRTGFRRVVATANLRSGVGLFWRAAVASVAANGRQMSELSKSERGRCGGDAGPDSFSLEPAATAVE